MKWSASIPIIVYNASRIHTMDSSIASKGTLVGPGNGFCIVNHRIHAIGDLENIKVACPEPRELVDARGSVIMPGLIDSHMHLMEGGLTLVRPSLNSCNSEEEVVETLQEFVKQHPLSSGEWIQGFGWDQNRWPHKQFPSKNSLDKVFPENPVWLQRIDGHAAWANSAAMRLVSIPSSDPVGGVIVRDPDGNPTGVFTDTARKIIQQILPRPTIKEQRKAIQAATSACVSQGITSIHNPGVGEDEVNLYKTLIDEGSMSIRQYAMWLGTATGDTGTKVNIGTPKVLDYKHKGLLTVGAVKLYMDGALGSWGASMILPYNDKPCQTGQLRMTPDEFKGNVTAWMAHGYQVATHAIGDLANRIVLNTYAEVCTKKANSKRFLDRTKGVRNLLSMEEQQGNSISLRVGGRGAVVDTSTSLAASDLRFRIEHFQLVNVTDFPILGAHPRCILASMQPTHATSDMGFAADRIGSERLKGAYAWNSTLRVQDDLQHQNSKYRLRGKNNEREIWQPKLALGSDWPTVGRVPPVLGFYAAITRQDEKGVPHGGWQPQERISRWHALKGYTIDAAFAGFQEHEQGSISVGKYADFVFVDTDWLDASRPPQEVLQTKFIATFVGGVRVPYDTTYNSL